MLRKIDSNIWVAEQPLRYLGLSVGTRMTVLRFNNRELAVISPIQASDTMVSQLGELGTVQHIIAPNLYHYLFIARFKALYPNAIMKMMSLVGGSVRGAFEGLFVNDCGKTAKEISVRHQTYRRLVIKQVLDFLERSRKGNSYGFCHY